VDQISGDVFSVNNNTQASNRHSLLTRCICNTSVMSTRDITHCGGPAPHYIFFCMCINNVSISLDNSRFVHQYSNNSFSTTAEFLQFIPLLRLANIKVIDNIHLEIVALLLAYIVSWIMLRLFSSCRMTFSALLYCCGGSKCHVIKAHLHIESRSRVIRLSRENVARIGYFSLANNSFVSLSRVIVFVHIIIFCVFNRVYVLFCF